MKRGFNDEVEMSELQNNSNNIDILDPRVNQVEVDNPNTNLSQNSIEDIMDHKPNDSSNAAGNQVGAGQSSAQKQQTTAPLSTNLTPLPPPSRSSHIQIED